MLVAKDVKEEIIFKVGPTPQCLFVARPSVGILDRRLQLSRIASARLCVFVVALMFLTLVMLVMLSAAPLPFSACTTHTHTVQVTLSDCSVQ